jgi:hypothetical protein
MEEVGKVRRVATQDGRRNRGGRGAALTAKSERDGEDRREYRTGAPMNAPKLMSLNPDS